MQTVFRILKYCLSLLLLLGSGEHLCAIEPHFYAVPNAGNLSSSTVNGFFKDTLGRMWIATTREAVVFDGYRSFSVSFIGDDNEACAVFVVRELSDNQFLVGTSCGLYKLNFHSSMPKIEPVLQGRFGKVNVLEEGPDQEWYAGTDDGLMIISPKLKSVENIRIPAMRADGANRINTIKFYDNKAYLGTDAGLYVYQPSTRKVTQLFADEYPDLSVKAQIAINGQGYFGTTDGVFEFNPVTGTVHRLFQLGNSITGLARDSQRNLYVSTDGGGIFQYSLSEGAMVDHFTDRAITGKALHSNQIYSLFIDDNDQMFVGYYLLGADYSVFTSDLFQLYRHGDFTTEDMSVRSILTTPKHLMLGTRDGAWLFDKQAGKVRHLTRPALKSDLVLSTLYYNDKFLLGTYGGGMMEYDPENETLTYPTQIAQIDLHKDMSVFSMKKDARERVWLATSKGLLRFSDGKFDLHLTSENSGQTFDNVFEVAIDSRQRVWVCTAGGLYLLDERRGKLVNDVFPDNFIHNHDVRQVFESSTHLLYFVTNEGRLFIYDSDFRRHQLSDNVSYLRSARGVTEDPSGNIWITTSNGLLRLKPRDRHLALYGFSDGIPTPTFNPGSPAVDSEGHLYLGNIKGLYTTDTRQSTDGRLSMLKAVPTFVEDSRGVHPVNATEDEDGNYRIALRQPENKIKLYISDFSYSIDGSSRFEYSVDNGRTWESVAPDMSATLNDLSGGKMKVRLRQHGNPLTEVKIIVTNPYSDMLKFSLIVGSVILLLLVAGWILAPIWKARLLRRMVPIPNLPIQAEPAADVRDGKKEGSDEPEQKKYVSNTLSDEQCAALVKRMESLLKRTKMYVNPDLKLGDISKELDVSSHKLSYVFSQYLKTGYYDYIYKYRVEEFKELARQDKKQRYTLIALSEKAGFQSRATFFRAFKKIEGITPGEFLKQLQD